MRTLEGCDLSSENFGSLDDQTKKNAEKVAREKEDINNKVKGKLIEELNKVAENVGSTTKGNQKVVEAVKNAGNTIKGKQKVVEAANELRFTPPFTLNISALESDETRVRRMPRRGKRIPKMSWWKLSLYRDLQGKKPVGKWSKTYERRYIFHYIHNKELEVLFNKDIEVAKNLIARTRKTRSELIAVKFIDPLQLYNSANDSKLYFLTLADESRLLGNEHMNICLYFLRKTNCYHGFFLRTTSTETYYDYRFTRQYPIWLEIVESFDWKKESLLTDAVYGVNRKCGISWETMDNVIFPCVESIDGTDHSFVIEFKVDENLLVIYDVMLLGADHRLKLIEHAQKYAEMIPSLLKFVQFHKYRPSYGNEYDSLSVEFADLPVGIETKCSKAVALRIIDMLMSGLVPQKDEMNLKKFRCDLAMNLWAHGMWKLRSKLEIQPEIVGVEYGKESNKLCPVELHRKLSLLV